MKKINLTHNANRIKEKNYIIISVEAEKTHDKIGHPFMIKQNKTTTRNLGIEGNRRESHRVHL